MKSVSAGLAAMLASETQTLATLWTITRTDGVVLAFTDHDEDIPYNSLTYLSASGYDATDISSAATLQVDNLELSGPLASPNITEADLRAGLWDNAKVRIDLINWADTSMGVMNQRVGRLGEVTIDRLKFTTELRGLLQALTTSIVESTSASCRAALGNARCKIDIADFTVTGSIDSVDPGGLILYDAARTEPATDSGSGYFEHGVITFNSGLNDGLRMEIKANAVGELTLGQPMPYAVAPGDTYSLHAGCDRLFSTCRDRFDNVVNFRGEPHLRGNDIMFQQGRRT